MPAPHDSAPAREQSRTRASPTGQPANRPIGTVFSINFLRHQTLPRYLRSVLVYGALGYLAVNAALMVGLLALGFHTEATRQRLVQGQLSAPASVTAMAREMEALQERATQDLAKLDILTTLQTQRFPVGGKLAALTSTLPGRTWITGLSGDRKERSMTVQAAYLINPDSPYDLPAKLWMDALSADPRFGRGLRRLELGASAKKKQGRVELFTFELMAEWGATR